MDKNGRAGGATEGRSELRKAASAAPTITASWRPSSVNTEERTAELVWTTGSDVERTDLWTGQAYVERLMVTEDAVDLTRLQAGAALLDTHDRLSVRNQIGVVEAASIQAGEGHARVRFSERADDIFADVANGIIRNVSVGYQHNERRVTERDDGPDLHEITRWTPFEISMVPVGADAGAQIRAHNTNESDRPMTVETSTTTERQPDKAELRRQNYILTQCSRQHLGADFAQRLIDGGLSLDECRTKVVDELARRDDETQIDNHHWHDEEIPHRQRILAGGGSRERSFADDAAEGLLVRERILKDTESPGAREFVDATFDTVAERAAMLGGVDLRTVRDRPTLFKRAFITSTTLADTLATFSTRSLMSGYEASPRTFVDAFRESVSRNFRANERIRVSDTPALAVVAEGANFQEVTLSDRKESFTIAKYGHLLKYTIEAMVNDDLGAIGREAERAGFAAAVTESDVFWSVITTNANMSDATPIFDAGESNLVSAVALSADALEDAREYFRNATTENSVKLNLQPKYLFVAPDLERTAEKLVKPPVNHSTATLTDVLSNAYANQLELRVESRLPAGDWMLAADFRQIDTLEYAWLEGRRGVSVEQDGDFDSMGIKFRVADMFGAGAIDRRGVYYNDAA